MEHFQFGVRTSGAVTRIDLNRPESGNTLNRKMMVELATLLREVGANPECRVVVIESRGRDFCLGRDGKGEVSTGMSPYEVRVNLMGATLGVYEAISATPVPVIALVQGTARGFGAALATACDITLAMSDAMFGFPEIHHGIAPTMAMAATIRKIPAKQLAYLIYSGTMVDATQAMQFGMASQIIETAEFQAISDAFIEKLAQSPRLILETIKKYQLAAGHLSDAMASEYAGTLMALVRS